MNKTTFKLGSHQEDNFRVGDYFVLRFNEDTELEMRQIALVEGYYYAMCDGHYNCKSETVKNLVSKYKTYTDFRKVSVELVVTEYTE